MARKAGIGNGPDVEEMAERFRISDRIANRLSLKRRFPNRRGSVRRAQDLVIVPGMVSYYAAKDFSEPHELYRRRRRASYRTPPSPKEDEMTLVCFCETVQPD